MNLVQTPTTRKARRKHMPRIGLLTAGVTTGVRSVLQKQLKGTALVGMDFEADPVNAMVGGRMPPAGLMGTHIDVPQSERVARHVMRSLQRAENASVQEKAGIVATDERIVVETEPRQRAVVVVNLVRASRHRSVQ